MMDEKNYDTAQGGYQGDLGWQEIPPQEAYQRSYGQQADGSWHGTGHFSGQPNNAQPGKGFGIASLVLGILSLVLFWTFLNIPLAIIAVIFGIVHICRRSRGIGLAVGGIVTAIVSVILTVVMVVFLLLVGANFFGVTYSQTQPFEHFFDEFGAYEFDDSGEIFAPHHSQERAF